MTRLLTNRHVAILFLASMGSACASAPSGPPPFDPVGTYEYSAAVEGMTATGSMTIEGSPGAYRGTITSHMFPTLRIRSVTVTEQVVTIAASGPEGPLTLEFTMTDGTFDGSWTLADMSGRFSGTKTS